MPKVFPSWALAIRTIKVRLENEQRGAAVGPCSVLHAAHLLPSTKNQPFYPPNLGGQLVLSANINI